MVTQKNPRWDFQFPMYGARITLPNEKPLFKMSPADERERQHNRKRIMGKKSRRFFKVVDTEAPLANSFKCHPLDTPDELFVPTNNWGLVLQTRFVHHFDEAMVLVQTDGACRDNGRPNAKAASAVVYAPHNPLTGTEGVFSFPLRDKRDATSNRAEMIAVLAAIRCRNWKAEGFSRLVIGTDSEWIVKGATMYVRKWQTKNWRTASGEPVKNRDLWQELIWNIEANRHNGLEVLFWRLDRSLNGRADAAAKREVNEMTTFVNGLSTVAIIPERYHDEYVRYHDEYDDFTSI